MSIPTHVNGDEAQGLNVRHPRKPRSPLRYLTIALAYLIIAVLCWAGAGLLITAPTPVAMEEPDLVGRIEAVRTYALDGKPTCNLNLLDGEKEARRADIYVSTLANDIHIRPHHELDKQAWVFRLSKDAAEAAEHSETFCTQLYSDAERMGLSINP